MPIAHVRDARTFHDLSDAGGAIPLCHTFDLCHERQIVANGHLWIERRNLGQVTSAAFRFNRLIEDVVPGDDCLAFARRHVAGQDAHGGRLASAIWPKEAQHFAFLYSEADIVDGGRRAVPLRKVLHLDHAYPPRNLNIWSNLSQYPAGDPSPSTYGSAISADHFDV